MPTSEIYGAVPQRGPGINKALARVSGIPSPPGKDVADLAGHDNRAFAVLRIMSFTCTRLCKTGTSYAQKLGARSPTGPATTGPVGGSLTVNAESSGSL